MRKYKISNNARRSAAFTSLEDYLTKKQDYVDATKKLAGIWLDSTKAMIITQNRKRTGILSYLPAPLKAKENHSGGSEHTMNNAKQSGDLKYFKEVSAELLPYDEILIFGPGQVQEQLQHHLDEQPTFNNKKYQSIAQGNSPIIRQRPKCEIF